LEAAGDAGLQNAEEHTLMRYLRIVILVSAVVVASENQVAASPPPADAVGEGFSISCADGWEKCYESAAMLCGEMLSDSVLFSYDIVGRDEADQKLIVRCVEPSME
jgi:hypothetical protein